MGRKSLLLIFAVVGIAMFFLAGNLIAASSEFKDVIKMENKAYKTHTKGIIEFSHAKHVDEYKAGCGDCHHDDKNKPLTKLKKGDEVQSCIECHPKPGEKPKGKDAPKLSKKEELQYHAEALHGNCKGCHSDYNKKNKTKAAPTSCTKCHPKKAK